MNSRSSAKASNIARGGITRYGLRSKSESSATSTPKKDMHVAPQKTANTSRTATPFTPSSEICDVCKGIDDLRSLRFKDAIIEFTDKIEAFKDLIKSFSDNNSTLNHALDTMKHFILHVEPSKINDSFASIDNGLNSLRTEVKSLPNFTHIEERLESIESKLLDMQDLSAKMDTLDDKLASMSTIQSRFDALDNKLSQIASISKEPLVSEDLYRYIERLDSIEESINDKIRNISSANPHQNISERISKLSHFVIN